MFSHEPLERGGARRSRPRRQSRSYGQRLHPGRGRSSATRRRSNCGLWVDRRASASTSSSSDTRPSLNTTIRSATASASVAASVADHDREAELPAQVPQQCSDRATGLRREPGEWLVEEQQRRLPHDRPGQQHPRWLLGRARPATPRASGGRRRVRGPGGRPVVLRCGRGPNITLANTRFQPMSEGCWRITARRSATSTTPSPVRSMPASAQISALFPAWAPRARPRARRRRCGSRVLRAARGHGPGEG